MNSREAAQAEVLIRALGDLRDKMIAQMTRLERQHAELDAALRRDINEAQAHITHLQRRYLGGGTAAPQRAQQPR
jgi:hypothetical protein